MEKVITCANVMITNKVLDIDCILHSISDIFKYIILFLSFTLKIPQISIIMKSKSTKGLSIISIYLDFLNVYFNFIYAYKKNLGIYVWGESFFIGIQNFIIVILHWRYEQKISKISFFSWNLSRIIGTIILLANFYICLYTDIYPNWVMVFFTLSNVLNSFFSRMFQILTLIQTKNPGSLSAYSFAMRYVKNFMQAFYLLIQVKDNVLIFKQLYNGFFTLFQFCLILYYTKNLKKD